MIFVYLFRVALALLGPYTVYLAFRGEWSKATFFLVLWHLAVSIVKWVDERAERMYREGF